MARKISYHGYNHQPLSPKDVDYGDEFLNIQDLEDKKQWNLLFVSWFDLKNTERMQYSTFKCSFSKKEEKCWDEIPEILSIASNYFQENSPILKNLR